MQRQTSRSAVAPATLQASGPGVIRGNGRASGRARAVALVLLFVLLPFAAGTPGQASEPQDGTPTEPARPIPAAAELVGPVAPAHAEAPPAPEDPRWLPFPFGLEMIVQDGLRDPETFEALPRQGEVLIPFDHEARISDALLDPYPLLKDGILTDDGLVRVFVEVDEAAATLIDASATPAGPERYVIGAETLTHILTTGPATGTAPVLLQADAIIDATWSPATRNLHLTLPYEQAFQLGRLASVEHVAPSPVFTVRLDSSVPATGAPAVHARTNDTGAALNGTGVRIALLDTGIDMSIPGFDCIGTGCKVVGGYDYVDNDPDFSDPHGHGTFMADVVAGPNGMAPGAELVVYRVCGTDGRCGADWVEDGLVAARNDPEVDIVLMAFDSTQNTYHSGVTHALNLARSAGLSLVVPQARDFFRHYLAGNGGTFPVGGVLDNGSAWSGSPSGPYYANNEVARIVPFVAGPAVDITAAVPNGTCAFCDPSGYRTASGNSAAAAHAAGALALLVQQHPDLPAVTREGLLTGNAVPDAEAPFRTGTGAMDVDAASRSEVAVWPPTSWLGLHDPSLARLDKDHTITITNVADHAVTVNVTASLPGMNATVNATGFTLAPGASQQVQVHLDAPNHAIDLGFHHGEVTVTTDNSSALGTFTFRKTPIVRFALESGAKALALFSRNHGGMLVIPKSNNFDMAVTPGEYGTHGYWNDCDTSGDCVIRFFFVEHVVVQDFGLFDENRTGAQLRMQAQLELPGGGTLPWPGGPACDSIWPSTACHASSQQIVTHDVAWYTLTMGMTAPADLLLFPTDEYNLGWQWKGLRDHDSVIGGVDHPDPLVADLDVTLEIDTAAAVVVEHRLLDPYTDGVRDLLCGSGGGWGTPWGLRQPITDGERETLHLYRDTSIGPANDCLGIMTIDTMGRYEKFGSFLSCRDTRCYEAFRSGLFRPASDAVAVSYSTFLHSGAVRQRLVDASDVVIVGDHGTASGLESLISPFFSGVVYRSLVPAGANGHLSKLEKGMEVHRTYGAWIDDGRDRNGTASGSHLSLPRFEDEVAFELRHHESVMDGQPCDGRVLQRWNRHTNGLHPQVTWLQASRGSVLGPRFASGDGITLDVGLRDPDGVGFRSVTLTLERDGTRHTLTQQDVIGAGGTVATAFSLPTLGAGAWNVSIVAENPFHEVAEVHQTPGLLIGASAMCPDLMPVAVATSSVKTVAEGGTFQLSADGSFDPDGGAWNASWSRGGVLIGSNVTVNVTEDEEGRQCYDLAVRDEEGMVDTDRVCVQVGDLFVNAFASPFKIDPGETSMLTGQGTDDPGDGISEYRWTKDGSTVGVTREITVAPVEPGLHCYTLEAENGEGETDTDDACVSVDFPPIAIAKVRPHPAQVNESVTFDGSESYDPDDGSVSFRWTFEDGSMGFASTVTRTFATGGRHCATLTVTGGSSSNPSSDDVCLYVNHPPTFDLTAAPSPALPGANITFTATNITDVDGTISAQAWYDGGEIVATAESLTLAEDKVGARCVQFRVTDNASRTESGDLCVQVTNPPTFNVSVSPGRVNAGDNVTVTTSDKDDVDGDAVSVTHWFRGEELLATGNTASVEILPTNAAGDEGCVRAVVHDEHGMPGERTVCVEVNLAPIVDAVVSPTLTSEPTTVTFDGSPTHDPDGTIDVFQWTDWDGVVVSGAVLTRTIDEPGTYCATLTAVDNEGISAEDSFCTSYNLAPVAVANASRTRTTIGIRVDFDALASYDPQTFDDTIGTRDGLSYTWAFPGGVTLSGATVQRTFTTAGTHCATLTVTDMHGTTDQDEWCVEVTTSWMVALELPAGGYAAHEDVVVPFDTLDAGGFGAAGKFYVFNVRYVTGDPSFDDFLENRGCGSYRQIGSTGAGGRTEVTVPRNALDACGLSPASGLVNLAAVGATHYEVEVEVFGGAYGKDTGSYEVLV